MVKIPAHKGITGNELADHWAKHGMKMAKYYDEIDGRISNNYIPLRGTEIGKVTEGG